MAKSDGGIHKNHRKRMREKYLKSGFDSFAEHEILEMLLYYSIPRKDTNDLAHNLIDKYKTLSNVLDATPDELMSEDGISAVTATFLTMIPKLAKIYEVSKGNVTECLTSTEDMGNHAVSLFKDKQKVEAIAVICVDAKRRVKWSGTIREGVANRAEAYPQEVVETALKHKTTKIILAHNHPNGTLSASVADKEVTENLVKILKGIGVEVLDHIIVSGTRYFSMKEMGFRF